MGYRSDVCLMAVLNSKEQAEEVTAVYRMNKNVQRHNLWKEWRRVDMDSGAVVLIWEAEDVKFYEAYEDVQGLMYMRELLQDFADHRGEDFRFAWGKARIGEEMEDTEYEVSSDQLFELVDVIYENLGIVRKLEVGL